MKRKSIIGVLLVSMMVGMFSTSCQDMLSPSSERHAYTIAEDTLYSYWGILKSLQNIAERYVILNECRGDLVDETNFVSDTIGAIVNFGDVDDPDNWKDGACSYLKISDYYHVINSCNAYIAMCDTSLTTSSNKKYMLKEYAQVQSIRAWVYMQLLYAYGENRVPFYKEPMLTTDDINRFLSNPNHKKVSRQTLVDELAPDLEEMEPVEINLLYQSDDQRKFEYQGLLGYNNYGDVNTGNSHFVCHSSKCMFPVSIVLGDLYLLGGNYTRAAQHYYNYINTEYCGPLPVDNFYSRGYLNIDRQEFPYYSYSDVPYSERGAISRSTESITCIPSNKGKLEGKVMTDISRLFGFEADMQTVSDDNEGNSSSHVFLTPIYEHELMPSRGYEALCDSQKYEVYEGNLTSETNLANYELKELRYNNIAVGDARRAWIYRSNGQQWTFNYENKAPLYTKMVSKQNPGGSFTSTYPVIYRKSTVWLHFAEALNRAGFPGYAFAILKTGLCANSLWFPQIPTDANIKAQVPTTMDANPYDYAIKNTANSRLFSYCIGKTETGDEILVPEDWSGESKLYSIDELKTWLTNFYQQQFDEYNEAHPDEPLEEPQAVPEDFESDPNIRWAPAGTTAFDNVPLTTCTAACYYIGLRERKDAEKTSFLNFKTDMNNLRGQDSYQRVFVVDQNKLFSGAPTQRSYSNSAAGDNDYYTIGVHQRGCGFIVYNDQRSSYNYVESVGDKLKTYDPAVKAIYTANSADKDALLEALKAYIYDDANLDNVEKAVEDLIIDEAALELAFEGNRFSDLCRVALRRNDPNFLAERVAKRHTGEVDESLRSRLLIKDNWFLPIPE